jgi:hypothetical protein
MPQIGTTLRAARNTGGRAGPKPGNKPQTRPALPWSAPHTGASVALGRAQTQAPGGLSSVAGNLRGAAGDPHCTEDVVLGQHSHHHLPGAGASHLKG